MIRINLLPHREEKRKAKAMQLRLAEHRDHVAQLWLAAVGVRGQSRLEVDGAATGRPLPPGNHMACI